MIKLVDILFEQMSVSDLENLQVDPHGFEVIGDRTTKQTTVKRRKVDIWPYGDSESSLIKRNNYYEKPGIDTSRLGPKINKFAKHFTDAFLEKFDVIVLPVITSGFRGPKRQINAVWNNWVDNNNYLYKVGYSEPFRSYVSELFERTKLEETDSEYLTPDRAKKQAVKFLEEKEKQDVYMSNHQTRGAIDIAVTNNNEYNDWIKEFLEGAKQQGIIQSFLDERDQESAHFHIRLRGKE